MEWCNICNFELHPHENEFCDDCEERAAATEWIEETSTQIDDLAEEHGWHIDPWHQAQSGSRYTKLWREIGDSIEEFTVRVSDHGSCYCREDISISRCPTPDDHTVDHLIRHLDHGRKTK